MLQNSCVENNPMMPAIDNNAGREALPGLLGGEITFPLGLLGFPGCRRFSLKRFDPGDGNESPFLILDSLDQQLSFPVIHPDFVAKDYSVPLFPELLESLGAKSESELVSLLIVTVRDRVESVTVNLQGPLLIGARTRIGMQAVVEEFPLRYPLVLPANP